MTDVANRDEQGRNHTILPNLSNIRVADYTISNIENILNKGSPKYPNPNYTKTDHGPINSEDYRVVNNFNNILNNQSKNKRTGNSQITPSISMNTNKLPLV